MPLLCRRAGARGRPMLSQGSWRGCEACLSGLNRPSGACSRRPGGGPGTLGGSWGDGAPGGIRTPDQWLRKPLLYPAELRALCSCNYIIQSDLRPFLLPKAAGEGSAF